MHKSNQNSENQSQSQLTQLNSQKAQNQLQQLTLSELESIAGGRRRSSRRR